MQKSRKKSIVIEAIQFLGTQASFTKVRKETKGALYADYQEHPRAFIDTLEGKMGVSKMDWIIKGVEGEFYPCKPEIFKKTYDEVTNEG